MTQKSVFSGLHHMKRHLRIFIMFFIPLLGHCQVEAAISKVSIQLEQNSCKFCHEYFLRELEKLRGVCDLQASPGKSQVSFTWNDLVPFRSWIFKEIAQTAGYCIDCIFIHACGKIINNEDGFVLKCPASRTDFVLAFSNPTALTYLKRSKVPSYFHITGWVKCSPCKPYGLTIQDLKHCTCLER